MSTGFCVSVGWPVTSPGREDMPGSFAGLLVSSVVLGFAGRATLPEAPVSVEDEEPALPRVSDVEPVLPVAEPLLPEPGEASGDAGVAGFVFVSSAGGVSECEVERCIVLDWLRPCAPERLWCFFAFLLLAVDPEIDSFELPCAADPLLTSPELSFPTPVAVEAPPRLGTALEEVSLFELLSGFCCGVFAEVSPAAVLFAAGLLLGRELLLDEAFDEFPGSALLFWSAGSDAVPLSSVDWLFGVAVGALLLLVPVPVLVVLVCARAPDAVRARASAANAMDFMEPPGVRVPGDGGDSYSRIQPTRARRARSTKREGPAWSPPSRRRAGPVPEIRR